MDAVHVCTLLKQFSLSLWDNLFQLIFWIKVLDGEAAFQILVKNKLIWKNKATDEQLRQESQTRPRQIPSTCGDEDVLAAPLGMFLLDLPRRSCLGYIPDAA